MALSYQAALDYLYGLINYEMQRPERYAPDVVSLDRPLALMKSLGDPQEQFPILHLTGTKGKGSVSAMCAVVLQAAGLRVGLYSSPHLQDFRERFQVNGAMIPPMVLADLVARLRPNIEKIAGLTWFEVITALAFLYFAEAKVDVAVVEVGLGGRLDATNIIRAPIVSTITSLSYDHMHLLGSTLGEIAFEKAGIIKPGRPVVSAPQADEAREVLERIAAERHSPLTLLGRDFEYEVGPSDEFGQSFTAHRRGEPKQSYWTPLLGKHQAINGAVALATLDHARKAGLNISAEAIHTGLRNVNWPGRLEVVRRSPWLVLDVAHNGASAERLQDALYGIFLSKKPESRLRLVFGASQDKDIRAIFRALLPITSHLILMQAKNPRAYHPDQLAAVAHEVGYKGLIDVRAEARAALECAEAAASEADLICATGSLFVVGEIRDVLGLVPGRAAYLDEITVQTFMAQKP